MKFKKEPVVEAPPVPAMSKKPWKKEQPKPVARERYSREYTRDIKFGTEVTTYVWVFSEYKKPCHEAPQHRLLEEKFIQDGRDRNKMQSCPVAWEVDMEVRFLAYAEFQAHIAAAHV